jgi:hypothetical protein
MVVNAGYQNPPQGGNHPDPTQGASSSHLDPTIYMMETDVNIQTRAKKYDVLGNESTGKEPIATSTTPL